MPRHVVKRSSLHPIPVSSNRCCWYCSAIAFLITFLSRELGLSGLSIRDVQPEILEQYAANLVLARLTDAAEFIVFSRSEVDRVFERPQLGSEGLTLVGPCVDRLFDNKNECTSCSCKFVQL